MITFGNFWKNISNSSPEKTWAFLVLVTSDAPGLMYRPLMGSIVSSQPSGCLSITVLRCLTGQTGQAIPVCNDQPICDSLSPLTILDEEIT